MHIVLPEASGELKTYRLTGEPVAPVALGHDSQRVIYSAAHVVRNPFTDFDNRGDAGIDWEATLAFRGHLTGMGLGIAEAMDTAQRGMGLEWTDALELIRQTRAALPKALVANGCGTDHLPSSEVRNLEQVRRAYLEQVSAIQSVGGRIILMASRALAKVAKSPEDYVQMYSDVLSACDEPVILHWLGDMFDPELAGYWGATDFEQSSATVLQIIEQNASKIDGIKISLLDAGKEIALRRKLPDQVRMYTGDDFNFPELIEGDEHGFSHALLGIFDPLAAHASSAMTALNAGDNESFRAILNPTIPLARHIFKAPTRYYKTGVVFLAWLNGHQNHFTMLAGAQAMRSLPHLVDCFKLADACGALSNPDLAIARMRDLLRTYGV